MPERAEKPAAGSREVGLNQRKVPERAEKPGARRGEVGRNQVKVPERAEKTGRGKRKSRPKSEKSVRKGRENR